MYYFDRKATRFEILAFILILLLCLGVSLQGCAEDGVDYTYIEANAIFGHTASDGGERVFLLSESGLAYVDKTSGTLVETDIIPASFPRAAGEYVYCQLASPDADSANPHKTEIWRFPIDSPDMSNGERLCELMTYEPFVVSDRIYIEGFYSGIASYDLTGGNAREWNGELHIQTTADGEYTLVRLDDTGRHSLRLDGKEVCTVGLNPAADYRFNNFMYIYDGGCYYVSEGNLNVIRSGEPELLMSFGNNASSFGSAGILAITDGRIYSHGDDALWYVDIATGEQIGCARDYDESDVYFIGNDGRLWVWDGSEIATVE